MRLVTEDVFESLQRWHKAYMSYDRKTNQLHAASELVQASQSLAAACDDALIPSDQRADVARFVAEGGQGA